MVLTFPVYRAGLPADATVEQRVEATAGWDKLLKFGFLLFTCPFNAIYALQVF